MDLLAKYEFELTSENIDRMLLNVEKNLSNWIDKKKLSQSIGFMDLTSLNSIDTIEKIEKIVDKINKYKEIYPNYEIPASICVYPNFAKTIKDRLTAKGVNITVVGGCFPASQSFNDIKVLECKRAVEEGANEVDIVLALNKFLAGDYLGVVEEIKEIKAAIGNAHLKVILETGALQSINNIALASFLAIEAGADFIKTSTGKMDPAATPMAAIIMCTAIKLYHQKTEKMIGFKPAGGIISSEDAAVYYAIVDIILGEQWLSPTYFRLGASRLANNLLSKLEETKVNYF